MRPGWMHGEPWLQAQRDRGRGLHFACFVPKVLETVPMQSTALNSPDLPRPFPGFLMFFPRFQFGTVVFSRQRLRFILVKTHRSGILPAVAFLQAKSMGPVMSSSSVAIHGPAQATRDIAAGEELLSRYGNAEPSSQSRYFKMTSSSYGLFWFQMIQVNCLGVSATCDLCGVKYATV